MYTYLSKNRTEKYFIETSKISVIIPYRNEINNLPILINLLPLEFIWINDHSEDHSEKILESLSGNHTLLSLELGREGKKKALQKGIYAAKGIYILTLDADIIIHPNFFEQLNKTPITDLLLIPVRMKAKNWFSFFYELDYYFINSINIASGGYASFISASGASLLFNKAQFMEFDQNRTDQHIASGDDYFLLQYFSKRKKKISMSIAHSLIPTTSTPDNFKSFFNQRLRWIQKTKHESNSASILIDVEATGFKFIAEGPVEGIPEPVALTRSILHASNELKYFTSPCGLVHSLPLMLKDTSIVSLTFTPSNSEHLSFDN